MEQATMAQTSSTDIVPRFLYLSALDGVGGSQGQAPAALPPRKKRSTHFAGDWVEP